MLLGPVEASVEAAACDPAAVDDVLASALSLSPGSVVVPLAALRCAAKPELVDEADVPVLDEVLELAVDEEEEFDGTDEVEEDGVLELELLDLFVFDLFSSAVFWSCTDCWTLEAVSFALLLSDAGFR
ncbi:MAG: hypothetical protein QG629_444 [Patescibacteria group bacterium]|nr:hypothetical protein [Patescibacteria group bacterium]